MQNKDTVCIKSLAEADASKKPNFHGVIKGVEVLGHEKCQYKRDEEGLHVTTDLIETDKPVVFKIKVD